MNAESLMHERGTVAVVAHKDAFTREEKNALRSAMADGTIQFTGQHYMLLIAEEPDDEVDALALAAYEEFQEDEKSTPDDGPSMADLRGLKVSELQALADKEQVDLTGLKLKDDILGRMAAHFGLNPAE